MVRPQKTKLSLEDKSKIIDLWKRKREQHKHKRQRNNLRRLALILGFLILNGALAYLAYYSANPSFPEAISINGNRQISSSLLLKDLQLTQEPYWFFRVNPEALSRRILRKHPLLSDAELKSVISLQGAHLKFNLQEDTPWARFANGWLLTFSPQSGVTRVVSETAGLDFNKLSFASRALIFCQDGQYAFWSKEAKDIQKLIYLVSASLPEKPLKALKLDRRATILLFDDLEVLLGAWDKGLLERAALLPNTLATLQKYENQFKRLDLSNESRAVLKLDRNYSTNKKD